ncbi:MBL fold metallo-hydrolase [Microbacterium lacus]|uniref:MBL fold metallo-hydrolase n=1 Tax=Microbacterium lacus TaxID=415217 RepID=UPI00384D35C5
MVASDQWTRLTTRLLAPNPGPMTLDGTNTFIIREPGSRRAVLVDPGPEVAHHLDRIETFGPFDLIVLTHHHLDHAESAATLSNRLRAPVRASEPSLCTGGSPLKHGEQINAGGTRLTVIATPGHTADSVCFQLPDDGALDSSDRSGSILTGDTILGRGTTVLAQPEGALRDYLRSLQTLRELKNARRVLPAHGDALPSLTLIVEEYQLHRARRLAEVSAALGELGMAPSRTARVITAVTDRVYAQIAPAARIAAEISVSAQLEYLAGEPSRGERKRDSAALLSATTLE